MESPFVQGLFAFLTAGGTTGVGFVTLRGFWRWYTGKAGRERIRTRTIADERDIARNERDDADDWRRLLWDYASKLRGHLYEMGRGDLVGDWPKNPAEERENRPEPEPESRRALRHRRENRG